jgi:hypothetical protein
MLRTCWGLECYCPQILRTIAANFFQIPLRSMLPHLCILSVHSYKYYGVQVLEYLYPLSHEKKSVLGVQNILRILAVVLQSTFYAFSSTKAMYWSMSYAYGTNRTCTRQVEYYSTVVLVGYLLLFKVQVQAL